MEEEAESMLEEDDPGFFDEEGNIIETPVTPEMLSAYATFLQGFYIEAERRQAFFPAAHLLIWTYFVDLHKKFILGASVGSFWAQPSALKDLWACFFAHITIGLCHLLEAGDWTFTELVDACFPLDTVGDKIRTGIYAYLGKALLETLFNLAYFGSAKETAKLGGFHPRKQSHLYRKQTGLNPFHRDWNKGKHDVKKIRGVVVSPRGFVKACPFRFELYHARESATTAILGGYGLRAMAFAT